MSEYHFSILCTLIVSSIVISLVAGWIEAKTFWDRFCTFIAGLMIILTFLCVVFGISLMLTAIGVLYE